jgi:hypothetical protein
MRCEPDVTKAARAIAGSPVMAPPAPLRPLDRASEGSARPQSRASPWFAVPSGLSSFRRMRASIKPGAGRGGWSPSSPWPWLLVRPTGTADAQRWRSISAARGRPQPGPPAAQAPDRRARTPVPGRGHSSVGGPGRQRLPDRGRRSPERARRPHVRAGGVTDAPDGAVPDEGGRGGAAPGFGNALDDRARGGVHRAVLRSDAADRAAFRPTPGVRSRREPDHLRLRAGRRRRGGSRARRSLLPRDRDRGGSLRR